MSARWCLRCLAATAASTSWACRCAKRARCFEREYLVAQISRFGGNISRTAEFVGMERSALHRKLKALGHRLRNGLREGCARVAVPRRDVEPRLLRIAYVNGRYVPGHRATIHIEDRGYQFSDGVYEVCEVRESHVIDERRHLARLARSLEELRIPMPMPPSALSVVMRECLRRNRIGYGILYLQITRGVADAITPFHRQARGPAWL